MFLAFLLIEICKVDIPMKRDSKFSNLSSIACYQVTNLAPVQLKIALYIFNIVINSTDSLIKNIYLVFSYQFLILT